MIIWRALESLVLLALTSQTILVSVLGLPMVLATDPFA